MKVLYKQFKMQYYGIIESIIDTQSYYKMIISKTDISDDTITISTTVFNFSNN